MLRPFALLPLFMVLVLHQSPTSATFAIALTSAAGASILSLTAAQASTIAAVGVLAKLGGLAGLAIASRRGRRDTEEKPEVPSLELLPTLEVDDCYKRVICSASSGQVKDRRITDILQLFQPRQEVQAPLSNKAKKFVEAAQYGKVTKSVAKCEHRYVCSLPLNYSNSCCEGRETERYRRLGQEITGTCSLTSGI